LNFGKAYFGSIIPSNRLSIMLDGFFFLIAIGWVISSFVIGSAGSDRYCGFSGGFLASLIFSPPVGMFVVLASTKNDEAEYRQKVIDLLTAINRKQPQPEQGTLEELDKQKT
jgi:hypothetical protein